MRSKGRCSIRIPGFDYSQPGVYFLPICSYRRRPILGKIVKGEVVLSHEGDILREEWLQTGKIRSEIMLDEFIIMPNHFHGIVILEEPSRHMNVGAHGHAPRLNGQEISQHSQALL